MKLVGQVVLYAAFFALLGVLSVRPRLHLMADDEAIVSVSFSHAGEHVGECRQLSQQELMALPPNMRKPEDCPRERHPLQIVLLMDDRTLYEAVLRPTGLWADGKSTAYRRIRVSAGEHDRYVSDRLKGLRERARPDDDLVSILGSNLLLEQGWTVLGSAGEA